MECCTPRLPTGVLWSAIPLVATLIHHLFLFPLLLPLVEKAKSSARQKDEDATLEAERAALVERKKQNRKEAQEYAAIQRAEKKAARERFLLKQEVRAVTLETPRAILV